MSDQIKELRKSQEQTTALTAKLARAQGQTQIAKARMP
jgi:hypothetical protein